MPLSKESTSDSIHNILKDHPSLLKRLNVLLKQTS